ncbi:MAG: alkaline phosphatase family protein [Deltaproteobacteria bacterium]|nr:alkaline phosphatase family protein [Deltaproteobacteria bacterium]
MARPLRPVLVLALDGASFDVIRPMAEAGELPNLGAWMKEGRSAPLPSTAPPVTFPAWSSFMTGLPPGEHGIFDFTQKVPGDYRLRFVNATDRAGRTLFRRVGDAGGEVLVLGLPATHPPEPVPGLLVSGFEAPVASGTDPRSASDPERYRRIAAKAGPWMRPELDESARASDFHERAVSTLLARIDRKRDFALAAIEELRADRAGRVPDLMVVVFSESDTAGHHYFRDHDPRSPRHDPAASPERKDALRAVHRRLDQACGALRAAVGPDVRCVVLSDHGMGTASDKIVHLNRFLAEQGLLVRSRPLYGAFSELGRRGGLGGLAGPGRRGGLDRLAELASADGLARAARDFALAWLPPRADPAVIPARARRGGAGRESRPLRRLRLAPDPRLQRGSQYPARRLDQSRRPRGRGLRRAGRLRGDPRSRDRSAPRLEAPERRARRRPGPAPRGRLHGPLRRSRPGHRARARPRRRPRPLPRPDALVRRRARRRRHPERAHPRPRRLRRRPRPRHERDPPRRGHLHRLRPGLCPGPERARSAPASRRRRPLARAGDGPSLGRRRRPSVGEPGWLGDGHARACRLRRGRGSDGRRAAPGAGISRMKRPVLSLVFPAWNEAENLPALLASALSIGAGLGVAFEIVIVDDGSADASRAVIEAWCRRDARVRAVHHAQNQGYGAALRAGLKTARGEFVFFSDADLQFDLAEIRRLLDHTDEYEIVAGYRAPRRDPWLRRVIARAGACSCAGSSICRFGTSTAPSRSFIARCSRRSRSSRSAPS